MKIYTEVSFKWDEKQNKLVEISSESFDYEGELALATAGEWETWKTRWYDGAGNVYKLKVRVGKSLVMDRRISKSTDGGQTWEDDWESAENNVSKTTAHDWFKSKVKNKGYKGKEGKKAYTEDEFKSYWIEEYKTEPSTMSQTNIDLINDIEENIAVYDAEQGTYIYSTTDVDTEDLTEAAAEESLKSAVKDWERLVTANVDDDVELSMKSAISDLKVKEDKVKDAYIDLFNEDGELKFIQDTFETSVAEDLDKYTKDLGKFETQKEEGIEGAVETREESLETLRGEAQTQMRAADAKIGAAGFASTGVGGTAREMLAKEIGRESRGIDEGLTEDMSDVKTQYLENIGDIEKFAPGGSEYEQHIKDRARSAKEALSAWEIASKEYTAAKETFEDVTKPSIHLAFKSDLDTAGSFMEEYLSALGDVDPFAEGGALKKLGYDDPSYFGLIGSAGSYLYGDPESFDYESFYDPYFVGEGFQEELGDYEEGKWGLYDPNIKMPWERATSVIQQPSYLEEPEGSKGGG